MLKKILAISIYFLLDMTYYFWKVGSDYEIDTLMIKMFIFVVVFLWIYFSSNKKNKELKRE